MNKINLNQIEPINATDVQGALSQSGGTMIGEMNILPPVNPSNPATKKYVDDKIGDISTILATIVEGV